MLLSICIPSYNRREQLLKIVESVCKAESKDFNVVIVDNGSVDNISSLINDPRIVVVNRKKIVSGPVNVRECLDYGNAKYRMLCLDKDYIVGEALDDFLECLRNSKNVTCGYCRLNSDIINGKFYVESPKIEKSIYSCRHPSGVFFHERILKLDDNINEYGNPESRYFNNAFLIDLLYAYGLINGLQGRFEGILIKTERPSEAAEKKSYTYSKEKGNIYFFPENRLEQFFVFCEHSKNLNLDKKTRNKIIFNLYKESLYNATIGFQRIMSLEDICSHHNIECKKVTVFELLCIKKEFDKAFIENKDVSCTIINRRKCVMKYTIRWYISVIKNMFITMKGK